jgi:lysophospholipase L1-like esterase
MSNFWMQDGETMLFIGDSITDCGRRGAEMPLGSGYVRMVTELTTARYPDRDIKYINKGIGGNRITNLEDRWQDDVFYHSPDKLSIKIGINDLHSHLRGAADGVSPEKFGSVYDELLEKTVAKLNCPVLLVTPFYVSTDRSGQTIRSQVLDLIPEYINVVVGMSEKYGTKLVNLHDTFQKQLEYRDSEAFCPEPVHPNRTGHLVIAEEIMKCLED